MFIGVAVVLSITGFAFTITDVVATLEHTPTLAVKVYIPVAAAVGEAMVGLNTVLVNPLGPVQEYVVPMSVTPVKFNGLPSHNGPLLLAVAVGVGVMIVEIWLVATLSMVLVQTTWPWKYVLTTMPETPMVEPTPTYVLYGPPEFGELYQRTTTPPSVD